MPPSTAADPLESQLRSACAELERQVRAGATCRAEDFLDRVAADDDAAVEVIYTEFATRYQLGQSPRADEYLDRFPHWRDRLSRLFEIHHLFAAEAQTWASELGGLPSTMPNRSGQRLGRYEIVNELGRGAMGIVYSARQAGLDRTVALKVVPLLGGETGRDDDPGAPGVVNRFRNEAKAMASLQHPNIVQVFDVGVDGPIGHLAMELVEGGNLTDKITGEPLDAQWVARLMMRLARAVGYAHQRGVTHRDLKPANILLTAGGEPKIADFGLARCCATDGGQTTAGGLVGTPSYMAPEQAAGEPNIGPPADIYALGAILYELLTGKPPFSGASMLETLRRVLESEPTPPRQLRPSEPPGSSRRSVPRALETICLKCLEKEPARRYESADALAEDLRRFLAGEPILAIRTGPTRRFWSWCRRKPIIAGLAAALSASVVVGFALVTWQWRLADQQRDTAERGWAEAERQRGEADRQRASAAASLRQAHDAVHTYFTLVSDSTLLDTPGMQPLRSQLLQSALDHYIRFQQSGGDSPALRVDLAASYFRVALLHHLNDRNDDSIAALAGGVERARELLLNPPDDPGFPQRLAGWAAGSGRRLHRYTKIPKDPRAAGETIQATIGLWEKFAQCYPNIPEFRVDIATLSCLLGEMLHEVKQYADAEKSLRHAKAQWPPLLTLRPDASEWHAEHGRVTLALGDTFRATDQYPAAEAAYTEAIEIFERLANGPNSTAHRRALLATATYHLALMYNARNRGELADPRFQKAAEVFDGLVAEYPHIASAREGAASVRISRSALLKKRGETEQTKAALTQAVALLEQLRTEYPNNSAYRGRLRTARALLEKLP